MFKFTRLSVFIAIALVITGCPSTRLLEANSEFVSLMQQEAEATRLHDDQVFDDLAYDSASERLKAEFAANGDLAVKAANEAKTDQSRASLLNVAVRSYLKSGGAKDQELLAAANQGKDSCSRLSGLDALPATCGYFLIAVPQTVSNEWRREVDVIKQKQKDLANNEMLTVEDGKTLVDAARGFLGQLEALESAESEIDFANAGKNLRVVFHRQQDIIFCNSQSASISLRKVEPTGDNWDRDQEFNTIRQMQEGHKARLKQRDGGFPADTCRNL